MLRRTRPYVLEHARALTAAACLLVLVVLLGLTGPLLLGQLVDLAATAGGAPLAPRALSIPVAPDARGVLALAGLFVAAVVLGFLLEATLGLLMGRVGVAIVLRLKADLFAKILGLDPGFFREYPVGRLLARVESDTEALKNLFTATALQALRAVLTFVGIFATMLVFDWRVTLVTAPVLLLLVLATVGFVRLVRRLYTETRRALAAITAHVAEVVQGIAVIQHHDYGPAVAARLEALDERRYRLDARASLLNQGWWGFFAFAETALVAAVIGVGAAQVVAGALTLGTLVVFIEYVRQAFMPVALLSEFVSQVQQGLVSAERVLGILALEPEVARAPDARPVGRLAQGVRLEGVSFAYEAGRPVLHDVSFEVPRGKRVALVGPSGGGKSTLVGLLLRFHDPAAGRITVDGEDLRALDRDAWRRRCGLVLQEVTLFPGTVRENLTVFDEEADPAALARALALTGAQALVDRLPGGLDAALTERGQNLSHGERQLLSLARALVHDPDLLVLDEATSAVDPRTEARIARAVERLLEGRTALVVAHRLATVRRCDEIVVVEGGRVVERGTHEALWARGGAYRRLARLQFTELEGADAGGSGRRPALEGAGVAT